MTSVKDEWGFTEKLAKDTDEIRNFHQAAVKALKSALDIYGDGQWAGEWKLSAEDKETGDKVYVKKTDAYGNVYGVVSTMKTDPDTVFRNTWDEVTEMHKWNPNVKEYAILENISEQTQLTYNASEPLLGGLVSSRDFVVVRTWRKFGEAKILGACSVEYKGMPTQKGRVRGDNRIGLFKSGPSKLHPGKTEVVWIASMDLKGLLPKSVVERAMNSFMLDYVRCLRKHLDG